MLKVTELFPIPLAAINIGQLDPLKLAWMKNLEFPSGQAARNHLDDELVETSKGMYFLDKPEMKSIKIKIQLAIDEFVKTLDVSLDLKITTSWLNKTQPGDWIQSHTHECAMISGVYYPEVTAESSPIIFNKSSSYTNLFHQTVKPIPNNINMLNLERYVVQPKTGDVIMFPSHLEHEVPINEIGDRYSVGFNSFANNSVGVGQSKVIINE
mgnify:FL=1